MAKWTAKWSKENGEGEAVGEYASKSSMFDDMTARLGVGGEFYAVSSQGAFYAYEITKYGYHATESNVPDALHRAGRKN